MCLYGVTAILRSLFSVGLTCSEFCVPKCVTFAPQNGSPSIKLLNLSCLKSLCVRHKCESSQVQVKNSSTHLWWRVQSRQLLSKAKKHWSFRPGTHSSFLQCSHFRVYDDGARVVYKMGAFYLQFVSVNMFWPIFLVFFHLAIVENVNGFIVTFNKGK